VSSLLALVLGLLLAAGVLEIGVWVAQPEASYERWHASSLRYLLDSEVDWKLEPGPHPWGRISRDHFRVPPLPKDKPADVFRIAVLGGSAAFDLNKPDEQAWPLLLERRLNARANHLSAAAHPHLAWDALGIVLPHAGDLLRHQWIQFQRRRRSQENAAYWHRPKLDERAHPVIDDEVHVGTDTPTSGSVRSSDWWPIWSPPRHLTSTSGQRAERVRSRQPHNVVK